MERILIIGAGGIGIALAEYCYRAGNKVFIARRETSLKTSFPEIHLDLDKPETLEKIADFIVSESIDVVVNALGVLHRGSYLPEKSINQFDQTWFQENLKVNCLSSLLLLQNLNRRLNKNTKLKFIALSAKVGSITDNKLGGWLSYRISKSALNMGLKTTAVEWKYKYKNAAIAAYHPGTVDTKLSKPFQAHVAQLQTPEEASKALYSFIELLTPAMSGGFYNWNKEILPY